MQEWWKESAWMVANDIGYINPNTNIERVDEQRVTLTCSKTGLHVTVPLSSALGKATRV